MQEREMLHISVHFMRYMYMYLCTQTNCSFLYMYLCHSCSCYCSWRILLGKSTSAFSVTVALTLFGNTSAGSCLWLCGNSGAVPKLTYCRHIILGCSLSWPVCAEVVLGCCCWVTEMVRTCLFNCLSRWHRGKVLNVFQFSHRPLVPFPEMPMCRGCNTNKERTFVVTFELKINK